MEALKLIPQIYHDILARIVPGSAAFFCISFAMSKKMGAILNSLFDGSDALQKSSFSLILALIVLAYIFGHITGLFSDQLENLIRKIFPKFFKVLAEIINGESHYSQKIENFIKEEVGFSEEKDYSKSKINKNLFIWYDWLRIHAPEAGSRVAKLRAEYRMLSGMAVVMLASFIIHILFNLIMSFKFHIFFACSTISLFLLFSWANARLYRLFQWAIINQYFAAKSEQIFE